MTDENFVSWNIEKGMSQGLESLEQDTIMVRRATTSSAYGSPTYVVNNSCIKFEAIAQDAAYVNLENTAKEIIGPKDYIKGHPLIVINNLNDLDMISVNHMTMLYRRFVNEHTSAGSDSLSIHSVQWLPIYAGKSEESNPFRLVSVCTNFPFNVCIEDFTEVFFVYKRNSMFHDS